MIKVQPPYLLIYLSLLLGGGSLLAFVFFLFKGSLNIVGFGFDEGAVLWFDAALSCMFFIQHSLMIRRSSQRFLSRFFREEYFGAFYSIVSGVVLFALVIFWQASTQFLIVAEGAFRWFLRSIFIFSIAGFVWGVKALEDFDAFGGNRIVYKLRNRPPPPGKFIISGPYRYVRHPLYFFALCMIWSCPDLTADRLLFNASWTIWIVFGTILEERDLAAEFGDAYRRYQKEVPMLFPNRISFN
jgi:protein-S-isoprenylcysteine O-methyltransferase Ste14